MILQAVRKKRPASPPLSDKQSFSHRGKEGSIRRKDNEAYRMCFLFFYTKLQFTNTVYMCSYPRNTSKCQKRTYKTHCTLLYNVQCVFIRNYMVNVLSDCT